MKILTYNTHLFGGTSVETIGAFSSLTAWSDKVTFEEEIRRDRIVAAIADLDADVVGLTEVWSPATARAMISGLRAVLPHHGICGEENLLGLSSGLVLLSRLPLSGIRFMRFDSLCGNDDRSPKGFIEATMHKDGMPVSAILTHTQAGGSTRERAARASNFDQIFTALAAQAQDRPAVVLGDFNIAAEDTLGKPRDEYIEVRGKFRQWAGHELGMADAFRAQHPDAAASLGITYDGEFNKLVGEFDRSDKQRRAKERLDYVFFRGFEVRSASLPRNFVYQRSQSGQWDLSDHYPLAVELGA